MRTLAFALSEIRAGWELSPLIMRHLGMRCELIRESLSARLDGEVTQAPDSVLDHHLTVCPSCRAWLDLAETVTRQARITPAPQIDGLADRIMRQVTVEKKPLWNGPVPVRVALCLVAVVQLAVAVPVLILGHDREAPLHVAHEMGSWDAALAIGLLLAARRPSRAEGMSSLVGVIAALLVTTACVDLAQGRTSVTDEAPHLLSVLGWLLLHRLGTLHSLDSPDSPVSAVPQLPERGSGLRTVEAEDHPREPGSRAAELSA